MMLSCWSVACLVCGRVGGCGVVGWRVPGRAGDVWLVAERDGRTLVGSFLCGCWIGVRQGLVRSYPPRCLSRRRVGFPLVTWRHRCAARRFVIFPAQLGGT